MMLGARIYFRIADDTPGIRLSPLQSVRGSRASATGAE
jgi:hypothetical protein